MDEIATNRDLYRFIAQVMKRRSEGTITLEAYLSNLQRLARVHSGSGELTTVDPRDIEEPVVALQGFSWHELVGLLEAGQAYE